MDASNPVNSIVLEVPDEVIDASLGLAEDDDPGAVHVLLDDIDEPMSVIEMLLLVVFGVVIYKVKVLRDPIVRLQILVTDLNIDWHHAAE